MHPFGERSVLENPFPFSVFGCGSYLLTMIQQFLLCLIHHVPWTMLITSGSRENTTAPCVCG